MGSILYCSKIRSDYIENDMPPSSAKLKSGIKTGWDLIPIALRQWWDDDPFRLASSLAFYTVFSLAPILLITVGLASIIFSEQEAKRLVIEQIALMTGSEGAQVARQVLNNLGDIGRSAKAVFIGLTAALIGSTAVFVNLQSALNHIWRVTAAPGSRMWKAFIRDRLRSFGIVLAVGFLLLASMGFGALISGLQEILVQSTSAVPGIRQFSNTTISFTFTAVLFAMI